MKQRIAYIFLLFSILFAAGSTLVAQMGGMVNPVKFSQQITDDGKKIVTVSITARINSGWHLYDQNLPKGGPIPLTFHTDKLVGAKALGGFKANKKPKSYIDDIFDIEVREFEGSVTFSQRLEITDAKAFAYEGYLKGQACQDNCVQVDYDFNFSSKQLSKALLALTASSPSEEATATDAEAETDSTETTALAATDTLSAGATSGSLSDASYWAPVVDQLKAYGDRNQKQSNASLLYIFIYGFLGGLIALITPCVWPMIPMTVSFFLKRTKSRKAAIRDAMIYGLSIIVIYVALGLIITGIYGANKLNDLATNAVFNIIFFLILVLFAVSFFGAFELVLPAKWTNKMDSKADSTTGLLSIFFMAFTLVLVSFSCTGPIIGTLLVQAGTSGEVIAPAIGMVGFALALALPFSLFAIFPNMLQSMPKSGGWLNSVKVVLGFLELALSLKFLSVADLAYGWGILDRETFLALWIIIFALLGFYLLGKIRLPHDTPLEKISVSRLFMAIISLAFSVYMIPGLWGAPLKAISAFAPPLYTQDFNLYDGEVHAKFDDFDAGMRYAQESGKPVLLDFSGYGCVNCREMENSVWIDPTVKGILENDYILITLMTDDKTALPKVIEVEENGSIKKLRTIGDKWSYLQRSKFAANAQPYYITLDPAGNPLSPSYAHDTDISKYIDFLKGGLKEYEARQKEPVQ
ncbi:protein-disulfide reductase DsbD [Porphyromonas uenonis]|uniref:protein-disulfide reductase DsbD family protein n=1 Tax=Porphyromonas uenonis TaxID=281920 RepID=UPI0026EA07A2|nr:cytochrome c biogenesis protein CcdA [Porphyromonas uenonis]